MIAGGRRRPWRFSPGKTSLGEAKKAPKPSVKKLGESPGPEKMSRGILKVRSPIWMTISDSKSCEMSLGTVAHQMGYHTGRGTRRTAVELRVGKEFHERLAILWCNVVPLSVSINRLRRQGVDSTLEMPRNVFEGGWVTVNVESANVGAISIGVLPLFLKESRKVRRGSRRFREISQDMVVRMVTDRRKRWKRRTSGTVQFRSGWRRPFPGEEKEGWKNSW